jgi:hypothetical protein
MLECLARFVYRVARWSGVRGDAPVFPQRSLGIASGLTCGSCYRERWRIGFSADPAVTSLHDGPSDSPPGQEPALPDIDRRAATWPRPLTRQHSSSAAESPAL